MKSFAEPSPTMHKGGIRECEEWSGFRHEITSALSSMDSLRRVDEVFEPLARLEGDCKYCGIRGRRWKTIITDLVANIQPFSRINILPSRSG